MRKVANTDDFNAKELLLYEALARYEQTVLSAGYAYRMKIEAELAYIKKQRELGAPALQPPGEGQANSSMLPNLSEQNNTLANWLDSQDVTSLLHISKRTLQTLRVNGTLPFSQINNKIYYKKVDVERILQDNYTMYKLQRNRSKSHREVAK